MRHHPSLDFLCQEGAQAANVHSSIAMHQARSIGAPLPRGGFIYTGIEIELENVRNIDSVEIEPWGAVGDGSLRNMGMELLSRPIRTEVTLNRYLRRYTALRESMPWQDSIRTSTHIHLDGRGLNIPDIMKILGAYILVEPFLYRYCGPLREENIYCVPLYRADTLTDNLIRGVLNSTFITQVRSSCKYSGFYPAPLCSFGTLEFRMAPSFPTGNDVYLWVMALQHMYNAALEVSPQQAYAQLDEGNYAALLRTLLPESMHYLLPPDGGELADIIEDNTCDQRAMSVYELWLPPPQMSWVMPEMPVVSESLWTPDSIIEARGIRVPRYGLNFMERTGWDERVNDDDDDDEDEEEDDREPGEF